MVRTYAYSILSDCVKQIVFSFPLLTFTPSNDTGFSPIIVTYFDFKCLEEPSFNLMNVSDDNMRDSSTWSAMKPVSASPFRHISTHGSTVARFIPEDTVWYTK